MFGDDFSRVRNYLVLVFVSFLAGWIPHSVQAQSKPLTCLKVAKTNRPNRLKVQPQQLNRFWLNYGERRQFGKMKLVKTELAYYLLAEPLGETGIYAFELTQKGKRLLLQKNNPFHFCPTGKLGLETFLQQDGKIARCRMN